MARGIFLPKRVFTRVDVVEVDSCLDETHKLSNTITDHPVEEGFNVTDHIRSNPDIVNLRCFVSNTPISREQVKNSVKEGTVSFETTAPETIVGRGHEAYLKLKKLKEEGKIIEVVTSLCTYGVTPDSGLVIESLDIQRTRQNFDGLEFSVSLKQIRIVRNKQSTMKAPKEKQAQKKVDKGEQVTKPVDNRTKLKQISTDENGKYKVESIENFMHGGQ